MSRSIAMLVLVGLAFPACSGDGGPDIEFTIDPPAAELLPGETIQLRTIGGPRNLSWQSSNNAVASVVPNSGLVTGVSRGTATISAVAGSSFATATITVLTPPEIQVPAEVVFGIVEGDANPPQSTVQVQNAGDGTLQGLAIAAPQYGQGQPQGWLEATLAGSTITLQARRGSLAAGEYTATIAVSASNAINSPQPILVRFNIVARPRIAVSPDRVTLTTTVAGTDVKTVEVTNGGGGTLTGLSVLRVDYGTGPRNWLVPEPSLNRGEAPATLTITASSGFLPIGTYFAAVALDSDMPGVGEALVFVTLNVTANPAISLNPSTVTFNATFQGAPPPQMTVAVTNAGGGSLTGLALGNTQYGAGANGWLTAQMSPDSAPATITLSVNQSTIAQGSYSAVVPVMSPVAGASPVNLQVNMTVSAAAQITTDSASLGFGTFRNGSVPTQKSVAVGSTGGGIAGLSTTIDYGGGAQGWLDVSLQGGGTQTPATLLVRPNVATLARGTYNATVRISSTSPGVAPRDVPVSYTVSTFDADIYTAWLTAASPNATLYPRMPCNNCHTPEFQSEQGAFNYLQPRTQAAILCKIETGTCGDPMRLPANGIAAFKLWIAAGRPR
jgi:hypothetical protein